jgi:hypothetical protein
MNMVETSHDDTTTHTHIKDLIQLVKAGKINKTDAFHELRQMLTNSNRLHSSEPINSEEMENIPPPSAPDDSLDISSSTQFSNPNTPRFSKEDRRLLINKLIEKKRQDRVLAPSTNEGRPQQQQQQHRYGDHDPDGEVYDDEEDEIVESPEFPRTGVGHNEPSQASAGREREEYDPPPFPFRDNGGLMNDASSVSSIGVRSRSTVGYHSEHHNRPHRRSHSAGGGTIRSHSQSPVSYRSAPFTRRSLDGVGGGGSVGGGGPDHHNHKLALQKSRLKQEIAKEWTFAPKVKPLPVSIYGQLKDKDVQFYDRVMRWQREKELESNRRKSMTAQTEVDGCTFQPKINRNSSRAVRLSRGGGGGLSGGVNSSQRRHQSPQDTSLRLYESNAITQSQRSRFVEEEKMRENKLVQEECTFQPRLLTKRSGYSHVDPKYDKVKTPTAQEVKERYIPPPKDCTFTPKVRHFPLHTSPHRCLLLLSFLTLLTLPLRLIMSATA